MASKLVRCGELPRATREAREKLAMVSDEVHHSRGEGKARYGERWSSSLARRGSLLAMVSDECRRGQTCYFLENSTILMVQSLALIPEFVLNIF